MSRLDCEHQVDGCCRLASDFISSVATLKVPCKEDAYNACSSCKCPHQMNYVASSLAVSSMLKAGIRTSSLHESLLTFIRSGKNCVLDGVGSEMHQLLKEKGYDVVRGCSCLSLIQEMNILGPSWCLGEGFLRISAKMQQEFARRYPLVAGVIPKRIMNRRIKRWLQTATKRWSLRCLSSEDSA